MSADNRDKRRGGDASIDKRRRQSPGGRHSRRHGSKDGARGHPTLDTGRLHVHHITTLAYLLSRGARHSYVEMTTKELGRKISKSQQSASRHLADLERDGLIERGPPTSTGGGGGGGGSGATSSRGGHTSVRVTQRGFEELERLSSILSDSIAPTDSANLARITLSGVLVSGMGEGAYYMTLDGYTRQFRSKVGYVPFPGTLNVRLSGRRHMEAVRRLKSERVGRMIDSFSDGRRTYGWAICYPALLRAGPAGGGDGATGSKTAEVQCDLITLERTHHDDSIIELISAVCIREATMISDGSDVTIEILPE